MLLGIMAALLGKDSDKFTKVYRVALTSSTTKLGSFGFLKGGNFSIQMRSQYFTELQLLLIDGYENVPAWIINEKLGGSCDPNQQFITELNFTTAEPTSFLSWEGSTPKKGVYCLFVLNCFHSPQMITVTSHFWNEGTPYDFRDSYYILLFAFALAMSILQSVMWFANGRQYPEFSISLHRLFSMISPLKVVTLILQILQWKSNTILEYCSSTFDWYLALMECIYYTLFIFSIVIPMSGWCVFRESLSCKEVLETLFSSSIFASGIYFRCISSSYDAQVFALFTSWLGLLILTGRVRTYFLLMEKLGNSSFSDPELPSKVWLVRCYFKVIMLSFVAIASVDVLALSLCPWPAVRNFFFECGMFALEFIIYHFFKLREEFVGSGYAALADAPSRKSVVGVILCDTPGKTEMKIVVDEP